MVSKGFSGYSERSRKNSTSLMISYYGELKMNGLQNGLGRFSFFLLKMLKVSVNFAA